MTPTGHSRDLRLAADPKLGFTIRDPYSTFRSRLPLSLLAFDVGRVFFGRAGDRIAAVGDDAPFDFLGHYDQAQLPVQPLDDEPRRSRKRCSRTWIWCWRRAISQSHHATRSSSRTPSCAKLF